MSRKSIRNWNSKLIFHLKQMHVEMNLGIIRNPNQLINRKNIINVQTKHILSLIKTQE